MWFDVQTALKEIEGGLAATSATSATTMAEEPESPEFVASVADVAILRPVQKTSPITLNIEIFEERSAIAEYDGGLTRADSEQLAARCQGYENVVSFRNAQKKRQNRNENY